MAKLVERPILLDATWSIPGSTPNYQYPIFEGARLFDLGRLKAATPLNARYPDGETLTAMLGELGVEPSDSVEIYDQMGLFSSAFVRWAMMSLGHKRVKLLISPFASREASDAHEIGKPKTYAPSESLVKGVIMSEVLQALGTDVQIIDARPVGRFLGVDPEPREGLRSGHIPGAISLPYSSLISEERKLKPDCPAQIAAAGIDLSRPIITTCGSGVTAAGLAYIFEMIGARDVSVYMGSWAEWGASNAPIETGLTS